MAEFSSSQLEIIHMIQQPRQVKQSRTHVDHLSNFVISGPSTETTSVGLMLAGQFNPGGTVYIFEQ